MPSSLSSSLLSGSEVENIWSLTTCFGRLSSLTYRWELPKVQSIPYLKLADPGVLPVGPLLWCDNIKLSPVCMIGAYTHNTHSLRCLVSWSLVDAAGLCCGCIVAVGNECTELNMISINETKAIYVRSSELFHDLFYSDVQLYRNNWVSSLTQKAWLSYSAMVARSLDGACNYASCASLE